MRTKQNDVSESLDRSLNQSLRRIYAYGLIDLAAAHDMQVKLDHLAAKSHSPISIYLNSDGGLVYPGLAMYDALRYCPAPTEAVVTGAAMSMAVAVLQGATQRLAYPNATFMVHDGTDSASGHSRNVEAWGRESKRLRHVYYEILASRSNHPPGWWEGKCTVDWVMTAEQALQHGLIDKIVEVPT
jgi:ATP-dependent Clp protease protease subunit